MADLLFSIDCSTLPEDIHVVGFRGRQGLSEPYTFEIGLRTKDVGFVHDDAVLERATLRIETPSGDPYVVHGVFASLELLHEQRNEMLYRAVLVPKFWQLNLTRHSNVWTEKKIPDIIKEVLEWSGLSGDDFELRLDGDYQPREFVAQYKESNLAFISRWMERLGLYYYFEQGDDQEKLIILDGKSFSGGDELPVRYVPTDDGDHMALEAFATFRSKTRALPANVQLWDYDYMNPTLDVQGSQAVATTGAVGEISDYGDDNFVTPGDGASLAKIRAEQLLATQKQFRAHGRVFGLHPGGAFKLEEHPRGDLSDKTYLVTAIETQGNQSADAKMFRRLLDIERDEEFICDVVAIRDDVQYRAPTNHPWPRIEGYESATVCGEASSDYAQIDDQGRYNVRIKFDESDLGDGKASAYVRMQQPYGGSNEGFHFPLIKNTEVLLWFMGGDPDRPVIAGVAPNLLTPSPVTVNNHTQNIIQTVNNNQIIIEDLLDQQFVYVYCPVETTWIHLGVLNEGFNLIMKTEGHVHFDFTGKQVIEIDNTLLEHVKLDVTYNYDTNWFVNVKANNTVVIDKCWNLTVKDSVNWTITNNWASMIGGDVSMMIGGNELHFVMKNQVNQVVENQVNMINVDQSNTILGKQETTVNGDQIEIVNGNFTGTFGANYTETITGSYKHTVLSDSTWLKTGAEAVVTIAAKAEAKLSADAEFTVGAKASIAVAISAEMKLALALEAVMGVKIECDMSAKVAIEAGGTIKQKTADIAGKSILRLDNSPLRVLSQNLVLVA